MTLEGAEKLAAVEQPRSHWDGDDNPGNPRNWSTTRKAISTTIMCLIALTTTATASMYPSGLEQVQREFHTSTTVALLPLSAFSLGLGFGPVISSPLSETFGRKLVYLLTLPFMDLFLVGVGLSQSIGALITLRFLAGLFAAPGISVAAGTISDYTPPDARVVPLGLYYTAHSIGSGVGPLIGPFVVEHGGWRWVAWAPLIMAAVLHPPALFLRESYKPILLRRVHGNLDGDSLSNRWQEFLTSTIIRPLHMLFTEPLVGFLSLYGGFQLALIYTFVVASPHIFATVYGFSPIAQGLSFLGMLGGSIAAPVILFIIDNIMRRRLNALPRDDELQTRQPEMKLYPAMFGSLILPTGLFCFAWTARPDIHWIVPILAQGITFLGSFFIYIPCNFYMLDVYGAKYGASASGASCFTRYALSFAFPLFVPQAYAALGVGWATSLLGFLTVGMAPIPWWFFYSGPRLRARSAYEHGT